MPDWNDHVLTRSDISRAGQLIAASRFQPQRFLPMPTAGRVALALADFEAGTALGASSGGRLRAAAAVTDLPWESGILNRRMGTLKQLFADSSESADRIVRAAIEWASSRGYQFLLCRTYTDDRDAIESLEANAFIRVETTREYAYTCGDLPSITNEVVIREARPSETEELVAISRAAFEDFSGRFHSDPRFTREESVRIYEEWIRSCCRGYADVVLVAENEGRPVAFGAWKEPTAVERASGLRCAHYLIAAVSAEFRGRGIYGAIASAGIRMYCGGVADVIDGPTNIKNTAVHRALEKVGFEARDSRYTFHRWID
jgi:GNAT superfamily N-acetyltransferase